MCVRAHTSSRSVCAYKFRSSIQSALTTLRVRCCSHITYVAAHNSQKIITSMRNVCTDAQQGLTHMPDASLEIIYAFKAHAACKS